VRLKRLFLLMVTGSIWWLPTACQETLPPPTRPRAAIELGYDLYQRLSCHGCHVLQGQGGEAGPSLDGVGSRLLPENLETQILTPRRRQAESRMPSFAFVKTFELRTLLDFLQSLK